MGGAKRETNPRQGSNLLSIITYFYTLPIFKKGFKRDLVEEDIYETLVKFKSSDLGDKLEGEWTKQKQMTAASFVKTLFNIFWKEYLVYGICDLAISATLIITKPVLLGKLTEFFNPNQNTISKQDAYIYATSLITICILGCLATNWYYNIMQEFGLKVKICVASAIYRKTLRISSLHSQTASGMALIIVNKDLYLLEYIPMWTQDLCVAIVQLVLVFGVMYSEIGIVAIYSFLFFLILFPVQIWIYTKLTPMRLKTTFQSDRRIKLTREILNFIKIIKMYTWEQFFLNLLTTIRNYEIKLMRVLFYIKIFTLTLGSVSVGVGLYLCLTLYVNLGNTITAQKVFVVLACFATLKTVFSVTIPYSSCELMESWAIFKRIVTYLTIPEVAAKNPNKAGSKIILKNVDIDIFGKEGVLKGVDFDLGPGLTALTGPTGSGKSTLLKSLLQELSFGQGSCSIGRCSYASQEPWLFPGTVKENILFEEEFDQKRYQKVVEACALEPDFATFLFGDQTTVIDCGLNLSRGQKARINLARALYKQADVYLIDDCLSSVDVNVYQHIFRTCFKQFLKSKCCLVVVHQKQYLKEVDYLVLAKNGKVEFYDNRKNQKCIDTETNQEEFTETSKLLNGAPVTTTIFRETKKIGGVDKDIYFGYYKKGGGLKILILIFFFFLIAQACNNGMEYFISYWVDLEQSLAKSSLRNGTDYQKLVTAKSDIIWQFSLIMVFMAGFTVLKVVTHILCACRVSINLHNDVATIVINAVCKFFDDHLSGNILNRFSLDLSTIEEYLPIIFYEFYNVIFIVLGSIVVVSLANPLFIIPSVIYCSCSCIAAYFYLPVGRSIQRLFCMTRSPVIGYISSAIQGLVTIRASKVQNILIQKFDRCQDLNNSTAFMYITTIRAFSLYLELFGNIYLAVIIYAFLIFDFDILSGKVGLTIIQAFSITGILNWGLRQLAELENHMTSVERILEFEHAQQENRTGRQISEWPKKGKIVFKDVSLYYNVGKEAILKNLNFVVEAQEKIGIVGRTGAGKSSIVSVLFRLYNYNGTIYIDGENVAELMIDQYRTKISVIPQDPVIFTGTLRQNLDPDRKHDDAKLWKVLEQVEMKSEIVKTLGGLDTIITDTEGTFSIGQKQLICLGRALLDKNKILILDEATANVDPQTDEIIQKTIRKEFDNCTTITIAHKLNTVLDCDRVMVLNNGEIQEFESPKTLMEDRNSRFYKLISDSCL